MPVEIHAAPARDGSRSSAPSNRHVAAATSIARSQHLGPLVRTGGQSFGERRDDGRERRVPRSHRVDDATGQVRDRTGHDDVPRLDGRTGGTLGREHRG